MADFTPDAAPATSLPSTNPTVPPRVDSLPPEAIALAGRLFDAARRGETEILEQALGGGLPVNLTNEKGDSLLMLATYHGHLPVTQLLLRHKADPNTLNNRGQTPLAGVVFKNERAIAEVLIAARADPDLGTPSARDAVRVFKLGEEWSRMMGQRQQE